MVMPSDEYEQHDAQEVGDLSKELSKKRKGKAKHVSLITFSDVLAYKCSPACPIHMCVEFL